MGIVLAPQNGIVRARNMYGRSHIGGRAMQQDSFGCDGRDAVVADGLSAYPDGDKASTFATMDFFIRRVTGAGLVEAINGANDLIGGLKLGSVPGLDQSAATTFFALSLRDNFADAAYLGDSRIFLLRDRELYLLTPPHISLLNDNRINYFTAFYMEGYSLNPGLVEFLQKKDLYSFNAILALYEYYCAARKIIERKTENSLIKLSLSMTRAVTGSRKNIDVISLAYKSGDQFLLCTDGIGLHPQRIKDVLNDDSLGIGGRVDVLIEESVQVPHADNAAAILVQV